MKFWEPGEFGMKRLTPDGEILLGVMALMIGAFGLQGVLSPDSAADGPLGYIMIPSGFIAGGIYIWGGIQKKRKPKK